MPALHRLASAALLPARRRLGEAVRARVAGPDADAARQRIWHTPGPRWFTETDPIWRVQADASMFVGGITALLLQSLHPQAMAAVADHSGYRGDPWGRLQRTSHYLATTAFGTIEHAEQAIAVVRAVHDRVRGHGPDGTPYAAGDPHLLTWVHIAEIWSFLQAHQQFGAVPLTDAEADAYVAQAAISARLLGAQPPTTVAELEQLLQAYGPELAATPAAVEACAFVLHEPPLPWAARGAYRLLALGAVHLLPDWARAMLEIEEPKHARPAGQVAARLIRWAMAAVPG